MSSMDFIQKIEELMKLANQVGEAINDPMSLTAKQPSEIDAMIEAYKERLVEEPPKLETPKTVEEPPVDAPTTSVEPTAKKERTRAKRTRGKAKEEVAVPVVETPSEVKEEKKTNEKVTVDEKVIKALQTGLEDLEDRVEDMLSDSEKNAASIQEHDKALATLTNDVKKAAGGSVPQEVINALALDLLKQLKESMLEMIQESLVDALDAAEEKENKPPQSAVAFIDAFQESLKDILGN